MQEEKFLDWKELAVELRDRQWRLSDQTIMPEGEPLDSTLLCALKLVNFLNSGSTFFGQEKGSLLESLEHMLTRSPIDGFISSSSSSLYIYLLFQIVHWLFQYLDLHFGFQPPCNQYDGFSVDFVNWLGFLWESSNPLVYLCFLKCPSNDVRFAPF